MLMRADKNASVELPTVIVTKDNLDDIFNIGSDWLIYTNKLYGIQIDFNNKWNWLRIKKTTRWEVTWIENSPYNHTMLDVSKNDHSIMRISVYSYDEYERMLELSNEDVMCDQKCFKSSIIWHNDRYYFGQAFWVDSEEYQNNVSYDFFYVEE